MHYLADIFSPLPILTCKWTPPAVPQTSQLEIQISRGQLPKKDWKANALVLRLIHRLKCQRKGFQGWKHWAFVYFIKALSFPFDLHSPMELSGISKKKSLNKHNGSLKRENKKKKIAVHIPQPITASTLYFYNPLNK